MVQDVIGQVRRESKFEQIRRQMKRGCRQIGGDYADRTSHMKDAPSMPVCETAEGEIELKGVENGSTVLATMTSDHSQSRPHDGTRTIVSNISDVDVSEGRTVDGLELRSENDAILTLSGEEKERDL